MFILAFFVFGFLLWSIVIAAIAGYVEYLITEYLEE